MENKSISYKFSKIQAKNITLSAHWTIHSHDVKFIVDGEEYRTDKYNFNESIVLPTLSRTDYAHDLWHADETFTSKISTGTMFDEDIVLYGRSSINSYDVIYHIPGKEDKIKTYEYNSSIDLAFDFNQGFAFSGWFLNDSYTGSKLSNYKTPANNIDLYGKYILNTYSIVFVVVGSPYKTVQKNIMKRLIR